MRPRTNPFAIRSKGGSRSAAVKKAWQTRKRGGAGAVVKPRRILMADGTYRVGGKVALPKGVGRMDRNGRVMRSSTIGGMLIRFKE